MKIYDLSNSPKVAGHKHGRVPKAIRFQQILDIAEKQFIDLGYEKTTVESVRIEAGVSRPIIYEHFGSKDRLYLACVERARNEYEQHLASVWQTPATPLEHIAQGSDLFFSLVESNPARWLVLFGGSSVPMFGELGDELSKLRQGTIDLMTKQIIEQAPGILEDRASAFSHAIFAVGEHLGRWWIKNPEITKERVMSHHIGFITGGLSNLLY